LVRQKAEDKFFANIVGKLAAEVLRNDFHLRLKLRSGDAGFETRKYSDVFSASGRFGHKCKRSPNVRGSTIREIRCGGDGRKAARHDTDESKGLAIQKNLLADLRWIASETAGPQAVTDNGDVLSVSSVILRREVAAEGRLDTKDSEIGRGGWQAAQMLGASSGGKVVAY
jgi:hypothetical protein